MMIDPVRLGENAWIDRAALVAILRHDGNLILFLRGSKAVTMTDQFSLEEIEELTKKPD